MLTDYLNTGCDPDELYADDGRCHGPAYDGAHGCGRFASGGMCRRCRDASDAYWQATDDDPALNDLPF